MGHSTFHNQFSLIFGPSKNLCCTFSTSQWLILKLIFGFLLCPVSKQYQRLTLFKRFWFKKSYKYKKSLDFLKVTIPMFSVFNSCFWKVVIYSFFEACSVLTSPIHLVCRFVYLRRARISYDTHKCLSKNDWVLLQKKRRKTEEKILWVCASFILNTISEVFFVYAEKSAGGEKKCAFLRRNNT